MLFRSRRRHSLIACALPATATLHPRRRATQRSLAATAASLGQAGAATRHDAGTQKNQPARGWANQRQGAPACRMPDRARAAGVDRTAGLRAALAAAG